MKLFHISLIIFSILQISCSKKELSNNTIFPNQKNEQKNNPPHPEKDIELSSYQGQKGWINNDPILKNKIKFLINNTEVNDFSSYDLKSLPEKIPLNTKISTDYELVNQTIRWIVANNDNIDPLNKEKSDDPLLDNFNFSNGSYLLPNNLTKVSFYKTFQLLSNKNEYQQDDSDNNFFNKLDTKKVKYIIDQTKQNICGVYQIEIIFKNKKGNSESIYKYFSIYNSEDSFFAMAPIISIDSLRFGNPPNEIDDLTAYNYNYDNGNRIFTISLNYSLNQKYKDVQSIINDLKIKIDIKKNFNSKTSSQINAADIINNNLLKQGKIVLTWNHKDPEFLNEFKYSKTTIPSMPVQYSFNFYLNSTNDDPIASKILKFYFKSDNFINIDNLKLCTFLESEFSAKNKNELDKHFEWVSDLSNEDTEIKNAIISYKSNGNDYKNMNNFLRGLVDVEKQKKVMNENALYLKSKSPELSNIGEQDNIDKNYLISLYSKLTKSTNDIKIIKRMVQERCYQGESHELKDNMCSIKLNKLDDIKSKESKIKEINAMGTNLAQLIRLFQDNRSFIPNKKIVFRASGLDFLNIISKEMGQTDFVAFIDNLTKGVENQYSLDQLKTIMDKLHGQRYIDYGFHSTSSILPGAFRYLALEDFNPTGIAQANATSKQKNIKVLLMIRVDSNDRAIYMDFPLAKNKYQDEREILLAPGTEFSIERVDYLKLNQLLDELQINKENFNKEIKTIVINQLNALHQNNIQSEQIAKQILDQFNVKKFVLVQVDVVDNIAFNK